MIAIGFDWLGIPRTDRALQRLSSGVGALKPLWRDFEDEFHAEEISLFAKAPWQPLTPAYAERKRKRYGGKPLLRASDDLFKSLTTSAAAGSIRRMEDLSAEFGSGDPKAAFHRSGTATMPSRDPLAKPEKVRYHTIAGAYLDLILQRAGF